MKCSADINKRTHSLRDTLNQRFTFRSYQHRDGHWRQKWIQHPGGVYSRNRGSKVNPRKCSKHVENELNGDKVLGETSLGVTALVLLQWQLKTQAKWRHLDWFQWYLGLLLGYGKGAPIGSTLLQNTTANSGPNTEKSTYLKALEGNQEQYWRGINTWKSGTALATSRFLWFLAWGKAAVTTIPDG